MIILLCQIDFWTCVRFEYFLCVSWYVCIWCISLCFLFTECRALTGIVLPCVPWKDIMLMIVLGDWYCILWLVYHGGSVQVAFRCGVRGGRVKFGGWRRLSESARLHPWRGIITRHRRRQQPSFCSVVQWWGRYALPPWWLRQLHLLVERHLHAFQVRHVPVPRDRSESLVGNRNYLFRRLVNSVNIFVTDIAQSQTLYRWLNNTIMAAVVADFGVWKWVLSMNF